MASGLGSFWYKYNARNITWSDFWRHSLRFHFSFGHHFNFPLTSFIFGLFLFFPVACSLGFHALLNSEVNESSELLLKWCWKSTKNIISMAMRCWRERKEKWWRCMWKATIVKPQSKSLAYAVVKPLCNVDVMWQNHVVDTAHHISNDVMPWRLALDSCCQRYTFHLFVWSGAVDGVHFSFSFSYTCSMFIHGQFRQFITQTTILTH